MRSWLVCRGNNNNNNSHHLDAVDFEAMVLVSPFVAFHSRATGYHVVHVFLSLSRKQNFLSRLPWWQRRSSKLKKLLRRWLGPALSGNISILSLLPVFFKHIDNPLIWVLRMLLHSRTLLLSTQFSFYVRPRSRIMIYMLPMSWSVSLSCLDHFVFHILASGSLSGTQQNDQLPHLKEKVPSINCTVAMVQFSIWYIKRVHAGSHPSCPTLSKHCYNA